MVGAVGRTVIVRTFSVPETSSLLAIASSLGGARNPVQTVPSDTKES